MLKERLEDEQDAHPDSDTLNAELRGWAHVEERLVRVTPVRVTRLRVARVPVLVVSVPLLATARARFVVFGAKRKWCDQCYRA
jgi:hypothetical protein